MSHRIPHKVQSTMDRLFDFACTVGVSGSVATPTLSCSLIRSTETHAVVSGTSPGVVTVALPSVYSFPNLIAWGADIIGGSTSSADLGGRNNGGAVGKQHYVLEKRAFQYPYGAVAPSSTLGLYANPNTSTNPNAAEFGGGSIFQVQVVALAMSTGSFTGVAPVSGILVDPVDASVAVGAPTANVTIWAKFRNTRETR